MPVGWYIVPMVRRIEPGRVDDEGQPIAADDRIRRYCQMDDFDADLSAVNGRWVYAEVLGQKAIVRVVAPAAALAQLNAVPGFVRIPAHAMDTTLGDLSNAQRTAIRNHLEAMGYTTGSIIQSLGSNLANVTLRQVLRFAARRRRKVRYDAGTDTIIDDGTIVTPSPTIEELEALVPET